MLLTVEGDTFQYYFPMAINWSHNNLQIKDKEACDCPRFTFSFSQSNVKLPQSKEVSVLFLYKFISKNKSYCVLPADKNKQKTVNTVYILLRTNLHKERKVTRRVPGKKPPVSSTNIIMNYFPGRSLTVSVLILYPSCALSC